MRESDKKRRQREAYEEEMRRKRLEEVSSRTTPPATPPTPGEGKPLAPPERAASSPPTEPRLEARKLSRSTDVETARAAGAHDLEGKQHQAMRVLQLHARHPDGLTDDEVDYLLGGNLWRRCSDLRRLGLIEWLIIDGAPVTRLARSGRRARVSVITQKGRGVVE